METLYERLTAEEKKQFWDALRSAMLWRGHDRGPCKPGPRACSCHACDFIKRVEELGAQHNMEFEEYC
jgi:hypothetical protein